MPFKRTLEGHHLAIGIVGRWHMNVRTALNAGVGLPRGAFDTYAEPATLLMLSPSVDTLFELAVGFRVRL